ncbi:hypothetical protein GLOIN_2v1844973 [Rhizophagus irregularis DAOM 181602=DAOM 197198]|uniref:Uncharacterized protein n=1 Tax=Rhizophagus irregularis (strain DAOM 181602 / DAOM 197198 / MUCL 43194) TaxID=747089 RepID=A0A2P4PHW2_RHIID|nr:hypothetical protein GLOIN_2v1844973 [Rhizophagus irregularis DAOM 181602=DAOM 197198]POG64968.1 hypothetical protein GLOIN_2v1844973 [Rhizophagus irregularis DAOM 181602=DAOM 197198]|eukprot:XP_025171834.1 hypothetical protein GLOIN_2v1844973 [Rhizophagus irregularis DAOM 181602=DAOM 197198]
MSTNTKILNTHKFITEDYSQSLDVWEIGIYFSLICLFSKLYSQFLSDSFWSFPDFRILDEDQLRTECFVNMDIPSKTLSDLVRQTGATSPISPKLQAIMECMEYLGYETKKNLTPYHPKLVYLLSGKS